jgi:hypothetical protein
MPGPAVDSSVEPRRPAGKGAASAATAIGAAVALTYIAPDFLNATSPGAPVLDAWGDLCVFSPFIATSLIHGRYALRQLAQGLLPRSAQKKLTKCRALSFLGLDQAIRERKQIAELFPVVQDTVARANALWPRMKTYSEQRGQPYERDRRELCAGTMKCIVSDLGMEDGVVTGGKMVKQLRVGQGRRYSARPFDWQARELRRLDDSLAFWESALPAD